MSIQLKYYNIIIPISNFSKCQDIKDLAGILDFYNKQGKLKSVWYDDHLFTIGGIMGPGDIENEVDALEKLGFNLNKNIDDKLCWNDLCVTDFSGGPTLPCSWIKCHIDSRSISYAWLNGQEPGDMIEPK